MRILDSPLLALAWGPFAWSTATLIVAVASLVACIALLVLSKTPWGSNRPTHKYAAISLAAHLLLLCVASSVRYGAAPFGEEEAPPVTVRIVTHEPPEDPAPPIEEPAEASPQTVKDEPKPTPQETPQEVLLPEEPVEATSEEISDAVAETIEQGAELDQPIELPQEALISEAPVEAPSVIEPQIPLQPVEPIPTEPVPYPVPAEEPTPRNAYTARGEQMTLEALEAEGGDRPKKPSRQDSIGSPALSGPTELGTPSDGAPDANDACSNTTAEARALGQRRD